MKGSLRNVHNNNSIKRDFAEFYEKDNKLKIKSHKARIITAHLIATLQIEPHEKHLVFILSNVTEMDNYHALLYWVKQRIDSLGSEDFQVWNNALEKFLINALQA